MTDIVEELRARAGEHLLLAEAAAEIERLRATAAAAWQPMATAPKDEGPLLLYCPGLEGHAAREIVVGAWKFDANRRNLGFVETGPWIEYPELHPERWARLPPRPGKSVAADYI